MLFGILLDNVLLGTYAFIYMLTSYYASGGSSQSLLASQEISGGLI